jgi:hypothetical protein
MFFSEFLEIFHIVHDVGVRLFQILQYFLRHIFLEIVGNGVDVIVSMVLSVSEQSFVTVFSRFDSFCISVVRLKNAIQICQNDVGAKYHRAHYHHVVNQIDIHLLLNTGNAVQLSVQSILSMSYLHF